MEIKVFLKHVVTLVLCSAVLLFLSIPLSANDFITANDDLDMSDVLIAAHYFMSSEDSDIDCWPSNPQVEIITPLYNSNTEIVAWYLHFQSGETAVINNSRNNPSVIEFGVGDNKQIRDILDKNADAKIVYNSPVDIYDSEDIRLDSINEKRDLRDNYPELLEKDDTLSSVISSAHENMRTQKETDINTRDGNTDFGFISYSDLPSGYSTNGVINGVGITWAVMDDYNGIANNHCAATCVTNMALNFAARGFTNLKVNNSIDSTFVAVHNIIGNGPVFGISSGATTYFSNRGYTLNNASISSFSDIVSAINSNRPCPTLLADYFGAWHWVLGVGYKCYTSSGINYLRIVNGWQNTSLYYYKINSGSVWVSTTQYWI